MGNEKLLIKGVGMVSSLGITALQSLSSIHAGISRKSTMPGLYYTLPEDAHFDEATALVAAPLSFLESRRNDFPAPSQWLAFMGEKAFSDLMENTDFEEDEERKTGMFVSLPSMLVDDDLTEKDRFITHFHNYIEKDIFPVEDYCFEGHTGVFAMMEKARDALIKGTIDRAIVGGVESCLFKDWLLELDKKYMLKSRRAIDGYIPGEAAAFLWIEKAPKKNQRQINDRVDGMAFTIDDIRLMQHSMEVRIPASALTDVISRCLPHEEKLKVIYGDLNGQSKRMDEWGYAETRLGDRLGSPLILRHPADTLGDMGAAAGAVLTILAVHELQNTYKDHDNALIFTASNHGARAAVLLTKNNSTMQSK